MAINTAIGLVGVAKQTGRSAAASEPAYKHGLVSGSPFAASRSTSTDEVACGVRANSNAYVESVELGPTFTSRAYADALGLYLLAALGNDAATTSGDVTTHVFSMGQSLPYLTVWGQLGTSDVTSVSGCKVDTLKVSFDGNKPLDVEVSLKGISATLGLASMPGSGEPSCFDGYFVPTDGTFKIETAGSTPSDAIVTAGDITVSNSVSVTYGAGKVMPSEVSEKKCTVSGSMTVLPDDMGIYNKMLTGSTSGTSPSGSVVYGSFKWVFTHTDDPDLELTVEASRVPFTADYVDVDPSGSDGEIKFSFDEALISSRTDSPVKVTLKNKVASY